MKYFFGWRRKKKHSGERAYANFVYEYFTSTKVYYVILKRGLGWFFFFLGKAYFLNVLVLTMSCDLSKRVVPLMRWIRFFFWVNRNLWYFSKVFEVYSKSWIRWVPLFPFKMKQILDKMFNNFMRFPFKFLRNVFSFAFSILSAILEHVYFQKTSVSTLFCVKSQVTQAMKLSQKSGKKGVKWKASWWIVTSFLHGRAFCL